MKNKLIWIDIETSGLDPGLHEILEIGCIATDSDLKILDKGISRVFYHGDDIYRNMDPYAKRVHSKNGLLDKVRMNFEDNTESVKKIYDYIRSHVEADVSPMCGNSVHFDRMFLKYYFPLLEAQFNYRNLDVSTLKILARLWYPELPEYEKANHHRAMPDIHGSIAELEYYRKNMLREYL